MKLNIFSQTALISTKFNIVGTTVKTESSPQYSTPCKILSPLMLSDVNKRYKYKHSYVKISFR